MSLFYFLNTTIHVSHGFSVHHQEFKTVHTTTNICQTDTAVCLLVSGNEMKFSFHLVVSSICLTYTCCCMYSLELLMMDGKTVRNM